MSGGQGIPNQPLAKVEVYDSILRWTIPSRSNPAETHVVDLSSYGGHGQCLCKDFSTRFGPLLARNYSPEEALKEGWVGPLRDYQLGPEDSLSCWHIIQARRKLAFHVARVFTKAAAAQAGGRR